MFSSTNNSQHHYQLHETEIVISVEQMTLINQFIFSDSKTNGAISVIHFVQMSVESILFS